MPPERFTVHLDDERAEWVAEQAEQRDASRAWVLRQAVDAARGADSVYTDSGADRTADRLDDRLARIEAAVATDVDGSGADRTADPVEARIDDLVDGVASAWDDDGRLDDRRAACQAALRHLYRDGELSKATAVDTIEPEHPVDGQRPESWWRQNVRDAVREVADYSRGHHTYQLDADET